MTRSEKLHAAGARGTAPVDFKRTDGWRLEVSDDGRRFPPGFNIDQIKGFGMQVVKARLGAKMTVSSHPGRTSPSEADETLQQQ
jgi:two-component sensor histidine kinase